MITERIPVAFMEQAKARIALSDLVGKDITLKRAGREWTALCPFHGERTPSFFVNDQKAFWHCFGCGAHGDHVAWLMRKRALPFKEAVEFLAGEKPPTEAQRWENNLRARSEEHLARPVGDYHLDDTQLAQQAMARTLWERSTPIAGTVAETYLRKRGITIRKLSDALRFTPDAWQHSYEQGWRRSGYPALIAQLSDSGGNLSAIQTTYLAADGSCKAPIFKPKRVTGPMTDAAVKLGRPSSTLGVAEGIETALSVQQMFAIPVWATCGESRRLNVVLPAGVKTVIILEDNRGSKRTTEAAERSYRAQGADVIIESPSPEYEDFNDALTGKRIAAVA